MLESNSYCPAVCKVNPTCNTVAPAPFKTVFSFSYLGGGCTSQYSVVTPGSTLRNWSWQTWKCWGLKLCQPHTRQTSYLLCYHSGLLFHIFWCCQDQNQHLTHASMCSHWAWNKFYLVWFLSHNWAPHSGINSVGVLDRNLVSHVQGKCLIQYTLSPAPKTNFNTFLNSSVFSSDNADNFFKLKQKSEHDVLLFLILGRAANLPTFGFVSCKMEIVNNTWATYFTK